AGSKRKLGLSIEGKVKERDGANGKVIKKAWLKNIAITYNPINQNTYVDLIKSFGDNPIYKPCDEDCSKCAFCSCETETVKAQDVIIDPRVETLATEPVPNAKEYICSRCGKLTPNDDCCCDIC